MKLLALILGFLILLIAEILKVYFIMPFPGSQAIDSIDFAYFIHFNIGYFRLAGLLLIAYPAFHYLQSGGRAAKLIIGSCFILYLAVFYLVNFRFLADKIFYQPTTIAFATAENSVYKPKDLVLGVVANGEAKAYPIENIGYHHQVRDTVGGLPVMVTYCTVCRTGRVFSPNVNDQPEVFRLVGMDHFNAMFEDSSTRSWWRQVNGEAIAGPLKGTYLPEFPSEQMALAAWLEKYPKSLILQPDSAFAEQYEHMQDYDEGTSDSKLTGRDSASWAEKSWVVGIAIENNSRAYDWNELVAKRVVNDTLSGVPLLLGLENDSLSFHTWERDSLMFTLSADMSMLTDQNTRSIWNWKGECIEGPLTGSVLKKIPSYQEFWHSWRTFHAGTTSYGK